MKLHTGKDKKNKHIGYTCIIEQNRNTINMLVEYYVPLFIGHIA